MTQRVPAVRATIKAPSLTTRAMADLTARYTNRLEDHPGSFRHKLISAGLAPTPADREILEGRRSELRQALVASPGDDADDVIYGILAGGNTFGATGDEIDIKVKLYAEALSGEPTWAIEQARRTFGKGGWKCAWDGRGVPSSANIVTECKLIVLGIEEELFRLGQILDAELVDTETTEDERNDALARWAEVRAGITRSNKIGQRTDDEIAQERSEQLRANERCRAAEQRHRARTEGSAA